MKCLLVVAAFLAASNGVAFAGEWQGYLMDAMCAAKMKDRAASHKAKCALSCAKSGFGIVTADGKFVKFDEGGNAKAHEALKDCTKDQELMLKVTGTMDGDVIRVESLTIR